MRAPKERLPHRLYLFYSSRYPEAAAFFEELIDLEKQNTNYKLIATMDESGKSQRGWNGVMGFINNTMITKYLKKLEDPIYYIASPPATVTAMQKILNEAGVNDDNIRTESFSDTDDQPV